jgi:hypothetical protein
MIRMTDGRMDRVIPSKLFQSQPHRVGWLFAFPYRSASSPPRSRQLQVLVLSSGSSENDEPPPRKLRSTSSTWEQPARGRDELGTATVCRCTAVGTRSAGRTRTRGLAAHDTSEPAEASGAGAASLAASCSRGSGSCPSPSRCGPILVVGGSPSSSPRDGASPTPGCGSVFLILGAAPEQRPPQAPSHPRVPRPDGRPHSSQWYARFFPATLGGAVDFEFCFFAGWAHSLPLMNLSVSAAFKLASQERPLTVVTSLLVPFSGMSELVRERPPNPIEFLASYLLAHDPQRMAAAHAVHPPSTGGPAQQHHQPAPPPPTSSAGIGTG